MIGGQNADGTPARTCFRFHTKEKRWSPIRNFDLLSNNLANLAGISINNEKLYVFDSSYEPLPRIYQYNIETDLWVQLVIFFKNRGISIPPSLNSFIYRISETKLLILSGEHENKENNQQGYSYFFNLDDEKIEDFRFERTLNFSISDSQGNRDFRTSNEIFVSFNDKNADLFDKRMGICDRIDFRDSRLKTSMLTARHKKSASMLNCGSVLCGL